MSREEIIQRLAEYFGIDPDEETGEYDLNSYDWTSGCGFGNGTWLSLKNIVRALTD